MYPVHKSITVFYINTKSTLIIHIYIYMQYVPKNILCNLKIPMIFNCILSMTTWFNFIQYYSDLYQKISQISEILRHYVHIQEMFLQTCLMWSRCDNICSMLIPSFFELAFPTLQHKTKYKYRNLFQIKALSFKLSL